MAASAISGTHWCLKHFPALPLKAIQEQPQTELPNFSQICWTVCEFFSGGLEQCVLGLSDVCTTRLTSCTCSKIPIPGPHPRTTEPEPQHQNCFYRTRCSNWREMSLLRVQRPHIRTDSLTWNSYMKKSYKMVLGFTKSKNFAILQIRYARICFGTHWEQNNLLEAKDGSGTSKPVMEKRGIFTKSVFPYPMSIGCPWK